MLNIKWMDFPNLEVLELYVYGVNKDGLKNLEKLRKITVNTLV